MSELTRAIIRGFGGQIGRNMANGSRRRSYTPTTRSVGRPAKSSFDKALEYQIGGRVNTMLGKQFNLIQEFENHVRDVNDMNGYLTLALSYQKVQEKFNDTNKYINMMGNDEDTESKSQQMVDTLTDILRIKTQAIVNSLSDETKLTITANNLDNLDNLVSLAPQLGININQDQINYIKTEAANLTKKSKPTVGQNVFVGFIMLMFLGAIILFGLAAVV